MGALGLDLTWAKSCYETLALLAHYGNDGSRYEDPRVIAMVEDKTVRPGSMARLLRLLKSVDHVYSEDYQEPRVLEEHSEECPSDLEECPAAADEATADPVVLAQKAPGVRLASSQLRRKTKRRKLNVSSFVDVDALDDDDDDDEEEEEEEEEEEGEERVHRREEIVSSGKRSFQDRIDTIIERFSRRTQEGVTSNLPQNISLIPAPPPKSIYVVDFYSGVSLASIYDFVFIITTQLALERFP